MSTRRPQSTCVILMITYNVREHFCQAVSRAHQYWYKIHMSSIFTLLAIYLMICLKVTHYTDWLLSTCTCVLVQLDMCEFSHHRNVRCPHSAHHCVRTPRWSVQGITQEHQSCDLMFWLHQYVCLAGQAVHKHPRKGHFLSRRPNGRCSSPLRGLSMHIPWVQVQHF